MACFTRFKFVREEKKGTSVSHDPLTYHLILPLTLRITYILLFFVVFVFVVIRHNFC